MKKIILLRHSKVDIKNKSIYANELKNYIKEYNSSNIITQSNNKIDTIYHENKILICSNLKRSIQTVNNVFNKKPDYINKLFNEAELPYTNKKLLKLPVSLWLIIFRILWFIGYSKNSISYKETKIRAKKSAQLLIKISKENNKDIILIGHGIMNRLIKKEIITQNYTVEIKNNNL